MPDTNVLPLVVKPIAPAQPDGYVVIASKIATGSVIPPYKHTHWHEWCASLEKATGHYVDLENEEHEGWRAVAIIPTFGGIPRPEMALSPGMRARLVAEERG